MPKFFLSASTYNGMKHYRVMGVGMPYTRDFNETLCASLGHPRDHALRCAAQIITAMTIQQREDAGVTGNTIPSWDGDTGEWLEPAILPPVDRAGNAGVVLR